MVIPEVVLYLGRQFESVVSFTRVSQAVFSSQIEQENDGTNNAHPYEPQAQAEP